MPMASKWHCLIASKHSTLRLVILQHLRAQIFFVFKSGRGARIILWGVPADSSSKQARSFIEALERHFGRLKLGKIGPFQMISPAAKELQTPSGNLKDADDSVFMLVNTARFEIIRSDFIKFTGKGSGTKGVLFGEVKLKMTPHTLGVVPLHVPGGRADREKLAFLKILSSFPKKYPHIFSVGNLRRF